MAIDSIMHETTFTDEIHTDCCLDVKKNIICYPGFSIEDKQEMLYEMNKIDDMPSIPPLILEGFFEYLNLQDIFRQDYSKFKDMEHELRKTMVNYIINDYSGNKELLNDFSLFKSISHFKEAFNQDNLDVLKIVLNAKTIDVFLSASDYIRKNKKEDKEVIKILMEKFVNADHVSYCLMQYNLTHNKEFSEKTAEEKIATFDEILDRNQDQKIKVK